MASPHVAGAAALLVSLGVTEPEAVERHLAKSARSAGSRSHFGAGILDAAKAVQRAALQLAIVRLLALAALIFIVFRWARRRGAKGPTVSPWSPSFLIPAFATGPGLLFFAPFLLPRHHGTVDFFARPIGDLDLLVSASWHGFLPFANVLLPFALVSLLLSVRRFVPVLAGLCLGTAAYLCSVLALGNVASPLGSTVFSAWCTLNVIACAWLGKTVLTAAQR
jgi:serine protease